MDLAFTVPISGIVTCISDNSSSRKASNSSSALSISSMSSTTGLSDRMDFSSGRSSRYSSLNRLFVRLSRSWVFMFT